MSAIDEEILSKTLNAINTNDQDDLYEALAEVDNTDQIYPFLYGIALLNTDKDWVIQVLNSLGYHEHVPTATISDDNPHMSHQFQETNENVFISPEEKNEIDYQNAPNPFHNDEYSDDEPEFYSNGVMSMSPDEENEGDAISRQADRANEDEENEELPEWLRE